MRILVTSSKGGIGKSTLAAALALALSDRGRRVLLCDCDVDGHSLDLFLGVQDTALFDLGDVAAGRCTAADALICPWGRDSLRFCPAPAGIGTKIEAGPLTAALAALEAEAGADTVILDTAGTVYAPILAAFCDTALVLSTQQPASVRAAEATALMLGDRGDAEVLLVINSFEPSSARKGRRSGILDIIDGSGIRCIGAIPYDRQLMMAGELGDVPRESDGMTAIRNIAARLDGETVRLFSGISDIKKKHTL